MDTLIYSTPHQDVKELTRYLGDLNWMGHGSAYDENEGRPRKRVSVLGTLRTMGVLSQDLNSMPATKNTKFPHHSEEPNMPKGRIHRLWYESNTDTFFV